MNCTYKISVIIVISECLDDLGQDDLILLVQNPMTNANLMIQVGPNWRNYFPPFTIRLVSPLPLLFFHWPPCGLHFRIQLVLCQHFWYYWCFRHYLLFYLPWKGFLSCTYAISYFLLPFLEGVTLYPNGVTLFTNYAVIKWEVVER